MRKFDVHRAVHRNIISTLKPTRCTNVSNLFYFGLTLYMFRTVFLSIIMSSRLYIQQQAFVKQILLSESTVIIRTRYRKTWLRQWILQPNFRIQFAVSLLRAICFSVCGLTHTRTLLRYNTCDCMCKRPLTSVLYPPAHRASHTSHSRYGNVLYCSPDTSDCSTAVPEGYRHSACPSGQTS